MRPSRSGPGAGPTESPRLVHAQHNLPSIPDSFIGRDQEIVDLQRLMSHARLITLTGTAGVGKTRLALELVAGVQESFTDGVWLVELALLDDGDRVPDAVSAAREQAGQPVVANLANVLRHREQLLILDTFEHLVAACASLASQLLRECPHLRILATTREALQITGESIWRVAPLSLPDADSVKPTSSAALDRLLRSEAAQLFVARTRAAMRDFQITAHEAPAVASICRQLDGVPLALELAASRVPGLGARTARTPTRRSVSSAGRRGSDGSAAAKEAADAVDAGLRLGVALWHFWDQQGNSNEGHTRVLALLGTGMDNLAIRAKAMHQPGSPHPARQAKPERRPAATPATVGQEGFAAEANARGRETLAVAYAVGGNDPTAECARNPRRGASPAEMPGGLTRREGQVAALVAQGYTNRAIAETLVITEGTAEGHVERIRGKLGFQSRAQVAVWAVRSNLLVASALVPLAVSGGWRGGQ
jgi:DNA-binding CsgD family transcriptional regulator